ncbi:MAG: S8 family serine peptidase, partial [Rhodoferax sp.]|nr:S8 family serine peptidase [Rhodoferax sp.]
TRAAQAGILTICAASNFGTDNDSLPRSPASLDTTAGAGYDAVVCVAAIDAIGAKASFSNYGRYSVDWGAPGVNVLSTVPDADPPFGSPGGYALGNGTSMATPHVTGAVALYASVNPTATAAQIKSRLLTAGVVSTPSLNGITLTEARLDAYALINAPPSTITIPVAPSGLSASAGPKGVANLAWIDRSNNEKGFVVERNTGSTGIWQRITTLAPNTVKLWIFADFSG